MIWNNDTKRLEFEDGTPVGAQPLNAALEARGQRARKSHLQETAKCKARREEELHDARKRVKHLNLRTRKNVFQRSHDNLVKPRPALSSRRLAGYGGYAEERILVPYAGAITLSTSVWEV